MNNIRLATLILALAAWPILAQEHDNTHENKASDEVTLSSKVKIGSYILEPGQYRIVCDRKELVFTRVANGKKYAMPCKGKDMGQRSENTELHTTVDSSGLRVADRLLLKGSPVDHTL